MVKIERIKEIYVEAKKSRNFQTYTVGKTVELKDVMDEEVSAIIKKHQAACRKAVIEQINIDLNK